MSWLKDILEGQRAVESLPQRPPAPSWHIDEQWWYRLRTWYQTAVPPTEWRDTLHRLTTHLAFFAGLAVVLLLLHAGIFATTALPLRSPAPKTVPQDASFGDISTEPMVYTFPPYQAADEKALYPVQVPRTQEVQEVLPKRRREWLVTYVVQPGDSVWKIAQKFGLKPETIEWANGLELNPDLLRVGQTLIIPPVDGVVHVVEAGETLAGIARKYKVKPEDIVAYKPNGLSSVEDPLPEKKVLVIPGGEKPDVAPTVRMYSGPIPKGAAVGTGNFGWPTTGRITARFGQIVCSPLLGCRPHMGIDIANVPGVPVVAADSGYVVFAGWDRTGYGNLVIINHGNGFVTFYAHMRDIFVRKGQNVAKGQRIGSIGASGNTTGPHLHFELRQRGRQRNPLGFLPKP